MKSYNWHNRYNRGDVIKVKNHIWGYFIVVVEDWPMCNLKYCKRNDGETFRYRDSEEFQVLDIHETELTDCDPNIGIEGFIWDEEEEKWIKPDKYGKCKV